MVQPPRMTMLLPLYGPGLKLPGSRPWVSPPKVPHAELGEGEALGVRLGVDVPDADTDGDAAIDALTDTLRVTLGEMLGEALDDDTWCVTTLTKPATQSGMKSVSLPRAGHEKP